MADEPDSIEALAILAEPTRRRVYDAVRTAPEPLGRDRVAAQLGIGRPLAAFHLEKLAEAGILAVEFRRLRDRRGPGAGRPAKLYRAARAAIEASLPRRRYGLAADLFAGSLASRDLPGLHRAAHDRGEAIGTPAAGTGLVEALAANGYEPEVQPDGEVLLRNCPFDDVAKSHRGVTCPMNLALLDGLRDGLGGDSAGLATPRAIDRPGYCCVGFAPVP
jgi:predicted ArsR family transcriptional regulator